MERHQAADMAEPSRSDAEGVEPVSAKSKPAGRVMWAAFNYGHWPLTVSNTRKGARDDVRWLHWAGSEEEMANHADLYQYRKVLITELE